MADDKPTEEDENPLYAQDKIASQVAQGNDMKNRSKSLKALDPKKNDLDANSDKEQGDNTNMVARFDGQIDGGDKLSDSGE